MTNNHSYAILSVFFLLAGCKEDEVYTLYRNSKLDETMRIHVATFDADGGEDYNMGNCHIARDLFAFQPGVSVRYWCEKGRYED